MGRLATNTCQDPAQFLLAVQQLLERPYSLVCNDGCSHCPHANHNRSASWHDLCTRHELHIPISFLQTDKPC